MAKNDYTQKQTNKNNSENTQKNQSKNSTRKALLTARTRTISK